MRFFDMIYSSPFFVSNILGSGKSSGTTETAEVFGNTTNSVLKLIGLIILCVLIIAASYFTTRFVGKKQLKTQAKSNFKNIDIYRVSNNKYLQIIQAGTRYFLISVGKDNVSLISELKEEDIVNWPPEPKNLSFKDVMSNIRNKNKDTEKRSDNFDIAHYNSFEDLAQEAAEENLEKSDDILVDNKEKS